jgi:molecular chaperone DnaK
LVEQLDKVLQQQSAALSPGDKAATEQTIATARTAMTGNDHEKLKQAIEQLEHASAKLQEGMAQGQAKGSERGPAEAPADDKVVDAEFEEVGGKH